ncbi:MAG: serine/threonine-protein kinase [Planctomycetaceae bacterium]
MADLAGPSSPESSNPTERQLGPFLLKGKLGSGGMAVVYRALYVKENREIALKLLPVEASEEPRLVARFEREAEILRKLKHPHIIPCFGGGQIGGQRWIAMQLMTQGTLSAELRRRERFPWQEVVQTGISIASALECAHQAGVIHRDLKPSNLMRSKSGKLKLGDFGIARDTEQTGLTATGRTVGTFAYMAPEQVRGFPPASPRTDLYALGCVLFELLTGKPPFEGGSAPEIMYAHIEKKPSRPSSVALDCPLFLDNLVLQLLEKDPEKRPRDASAVIVALREIEQKVAEQAGVSKHVATGGPTALHLTGDTRTVRGLLKPKKKRRSTDAGKPFHERTPFLLGTLALVLAGLTWALWPLSEQQLFERARVMLESDDPLQWDRAQREFLLPLRQRFPQSSHLAEVQNWEDRIEMHKAEEKLKFKLKLGREFDSEGERLYARARQYEQFGDQVSALERYQALVTLLQADEKGRVFVNLARRQIAAIQSSGTAHADRLEIVRTALERAENQQRDGNTLAARELWQSIVRLYGDNQELAPLVEQAQQHIDEKK